MGRFSKSKDEDEWDLASVERPWQRRPSIYDHICRHISPDTKGLTPGGARLPDENDSDRLNWGAAMDGAFSHHARTGAESSRAKMLRRAIGVVLEDATTIKVQRLYDQLLYDGVLEFIDPLLQQIVEDRNLDAKRLEELIIWLAKHSPDRAPVKVAIALLGVMSGSDHSDLLSTLGRHPEFTLYAAVALTNSEVPDLEHKLFELAQHVDGWGRIHVVERLANATHPAIKAWLLREGYKNRVMYEYLAYVCASAGGLRGELENESIDPALLAGAGDIIKALITRGPAKGMDDYADGAIVVERYLHHLGAEPKELEQLITVDCIQQFLEREEADCSAREQRGWSPARRATMKAKALAVKGLSHWKEIVNACLASKNPEMFETAAIAGEILGIDIWDHYFARVELQVDYEYAWYHVMQTDDPARIDRVVMLAEQVLPLDEIAVGAADEIGFSRDWTHHRNLAAVLQGLGRFPRKGWPLIRAGIRSPVTRCRCMALCALSPWGKDSWPPGAEALLEAAWKQEPNEEVRRQIETLLAGKELVDPDIDTEDR